MHMSLETMLLSGILVYGAYFVILRSCIYIRAQFAARRMLLRDKGPNPKWNCFECQTRARVGVRRVGGTRVDYCWRCETVINLNTETRPAARQLIPEVKGPPAIVVDGGSVVQLNDHPDFKPRNER